MTDQLEPINLNFLCVGLHHIEKETFSYRELQQSPVFIF
jgi:hypothetical protein